MSREIKFRQAVYSKDKFHHWHEWGFLPDLSFVGPDSANGLAHALANSCQYTGRKDRERNEIYSGYIVKLCYGIPPTYDTLVIEYADDETVGDISVSGWWMRNIRKNGVSGSLCKTYENDLEVIGNIHQNPELLGG